MLGGGGHDTCGGEALTTANVEDLVHKAGGRLALQDLAVQLVRAVARAAGGQQILAALLVRHVEEVPHRAPLEVPGQLCVPFERRDPPAVTAAVSPAYVARAAFVRDRRPVEVRRVRRADAAAVLADHPDRQPARVLLDVRDLRVDPPDDVRVAKDEIDLLVELPRSVEVTQPMDLLGMDADTLA